MDTKNNMAYMITLLVISIIILIGGTYSYFTAGMSSGETEATLRVGAGQLKIKFANTNSVQIAENVQPTPAKAECTKQTGAYYCNQSEYTPVGTKTFTLIGTNTTDASKNMKMPYNIKLIIPQNGFSSGALKYTLIGSKEDSDNGKVVNIEKWQDIPTGANTTGTLLGSGYFMPGENLIHTYTFNIYFPDNHISQDADKNKVFGAKIEITTDEIEEENTIAAPTGWYTASSGTLLAAIKRDNVVSEPLTVPGTVTSYSLGEEFIRDSADNYLVYGDTYIVNDDGTYTIENPKIVLLDYSEDLSFLKGKYIASSMGDCSDGVLGMDIDDEDVKLLYTYTSNKKQLCLIRDILENNFTYSKIASGMKTFPEKTEAVLASTEDDYGTSYYFRGAVENNYVEFVNKCWRIVRITGDGSIKLTLFSNNTDGNINPCGSENYDAFIGYSEFNSFGGNAGVGLMYGNVNSSTYAETHANINKSTILQCLEEWYDSNLASYDNYIADTIWCNDKSVVTETSFNPLRITLGINYGVGTNINYYDATKRLVQNDDEAIMLAGNPSLICSNDNLGGKLSKFTVSDTSYGNGDLDKKIGLLTADEVVYAGGGGYSGSYYLLKNANNSDWWTLSPSTNGTIIGVSDLYHGLDLACCASYADAYIRPSLSLVSSSKISSGDGTATNPYKIS